MLAGLQIGSRLLFLYCELLLLISSFAVFNLKFALMCDDKLSLLPFNGVQANAFADWWLIAMSCLLTGFTSWVVPLFYYDIFPDFRSGGCLLESRRRPNTPHYLIYRWWLLLTLVAFRVLMAVDVLGGCNYSLIVSYTAVAVPIRFIEYSIVM